MRQKFDLNATFALYTDFEQNFKFCMPLYNRILATFSSLNAFCYNVQCPGNHENVGG